MPPLNPLGNPSLPPIQPSGPFLPVSPALPVPPVQTVAQVIPPDSLPAVPQLQPKMLQPVPYLPSSLPPSMAPFNQPVSIKPMVQETSMATAPVQKSLLEQLFSGEHLIKTILIILFFVCVYLYFRKK
jgi:hypothetical protein